MWKGIIAVALRYGASKAEHYITLRYFTLHYITLHYITQHYITLLPLVLIVRRSCSSYRFRSLLL